MGNTRKHESTCRYVYVIGEIMKININGTEIDTADDTIHWDPMMKEVVDYVKANPSKFNEGDSFKNAQEILAK